MATNFTFGVGAAQGQQDNQFTFGVGAQQEQDNQFTFGVGALGSQQDLGMEPYQGPEGGRTIGNIIKSMCC